MPLNPWFAAALGEIMCPYGFMEELRPQNKAEDRVGGLMPDRFRQHRLRLYVASLDDLRRLREHARSVGARNFSRHLISMALRGARLERTARHRRDDRRLVSLGSREAQLVQSLRSLEEKEHQKQVKLDELNRREGEFYNREFEAHKSQVASLHTKIESLHAKVEGLLTELRKQRRLREEVRRLASDAAIARDQEASREAVDRILQKLQK